MKIKIRANSVFGAFPLILVFFFSIDTVLFGTNDSSAMKLVSRGVTVTAIIIILIDSVFRKKKLKFKTRIIPAFIIMSVILIFSGIVNGDGAEVYLSRYLFFFTAFVVVNHYKFSEYVNVYLGFIFIISIAALLMQIVAFVYPRALLSLPSVVNTQGFVFNTAVISSVDQRYIGVSVVRASSIFWEPGAYSIYLTFALIIELFFRTKVRFSFVFVFLAALIVTFSTTGYLAVAFIMLAFIFSRGKDVSGRWIRYVFIGIIVVMIALVFIFENSVIRTVVFDKLTRQSGSASTRYSSIFNGMAVAFEHPLLGASGQTQEYMSYYVNSAGNLFSSAGTSITNTVVGQFASYGLIFGSIFLIGTISFAKHLSKGYLEWILLTASIMVMYSGERFFSMFPFVWMFYGIAYLGFGTFTGELHCNNLKQPVSI